MLQGISLEVADGETVALLGRNGAGKTTTMRSIVGLTPAREGEIFLDTHDITHAATHRIARRGVAFVLSGRRCYASLTVSQNTAMVTGAASGTGLAVAERLHRDGCAVVAVDLDRPGLDAVARRIQGARVEAVDLADGGLADGGQVEALAGEPGPIDILVNNAAGGLAH